MPNAIYGLLNAIGLPHPLHPILVHITIGAVVASFLFSLVALLFNRPVLFDTARHSIILGFISAFFTIFMGFIDAFQFGWWLTERIVIKMVLSGVLMLLLLATILVGRTLKKDSKIPLIFYTLAMVNVLAIGFFGGYLVYGG
jgi:uncharacterized membrane protein